MPIKSMKYNAYNNLLAVYGHLINEIPSVIQPACRFYPFSQLNAIVTSAALLFPAI